MARGLSENQKRILEYLQTAEDEYQRRKPVDTWLKYDNLSVDAARIARALYPELWREANKNKYYTRYVPYELIQPCYQKQAIVYRALKSLEKRGLAHKIDINNPPPYWRIGQPKGKRPDHSHMFVTCPHCGFKSEIDGIYNGVRVKLEPGLEE